MKDAIVFYGLNKWGITAYHCDDGLIVNIGCMNNYKGLPIDNTRIEITKKYDHDHIYFKIMDLIEVWSDSSKKS